MKKIGIMVMHYYLMAILGLLIIVLISGFFWLSNGRTAEQLSAHKEAAQIIAFVGTPVVVALLGAFISYQNNRSQTSVQYVQLAIDILKDKNVSKENRPVREYALTVLDRFSPIEFTDEVGEALRTTPLPSTSSDSATLEVLTPFEEKGLRHTLHYDKFGPTESLIALLLREDGSINYIKRGRSPALPSKEGWEMEVIPSVTSRMMSSLVAEHRELASYLLEHWLNPLGAQASHSQIQEIRPSSDQDGRTIWTITGTKNREPVVEKFETKADRHIMM